MALSSPLSPTTTTKRKRAASDGEDGDGGKIAKAPRSFSKPSLRVVTDISTVQLESPSLDQLLSAGESDTDSLFDEPLPQPHTADIKELPTTSVPKLLDELRPPSTDHHLVPARRRAPPIPGLYFDPSILLPEALADELMWTCIRTYFREGSANQVMLFDRVPGPDAPHGVPKPSGLPTCLANLVSLLDDLLKPAVPPATHELLFSPSPASHTGPPRARQAIINLYWPGEGISPHVDLLDRYGDGIIGVSLGSGCAMRFAKSSPESEDAIQAMDDCALYLPKGSVLVMTKEARYEWTHGIDKRFDDLVEEFAGSPCGVLLERDVRLSITFRWLLPGADVVGSAVTSGGDTEES
ncbi:hypothetical protein BV20DRAFT_965177 [Pilatotrama ljubarskyi]|nr:hypothetical protein BV20DRAFT_965177 [Pilatotrama ljubarskyi]